MPPDQSHLRALFDACAELAEGEALLWIERNVDDAELRLHLALMLAEDRRETGPFKRTLGERFDALNTINEAGNAAADSIPLGARFGDFQIVRTLGSGGQGSVFLGRRVGADFEQFAAIKLLHNGPRSQAMIERFRRERQILARFEHPGIARLIDGGVESGVPYLIMEFVDGEPLDTYCEQNDYSMVHRLNMMAELCDAVAAAHRALIVHRDLKPSNILVTVEGSVKVLDFGIAKLLDEGVGEASQIRMLTPGYGSPEQISGEPITLASDVYALGVILRQLLTNQNPPKRLHEPWPDWPLNIARELRWVIEKATALDAGERYRDAVAFSEDIRRYLNHQPLQAHPPSTWYRARKFVERHRGGVTITALLLLTTLLGFGVALWQAGEARAQATLAQAQSKKAQAQAERAEFVRSFIVGLFEAAKQVLPRDQRPTPADLVKAARQRLKQDASIGDEVKADLLSSLAEVSIANSDLDTAVILLDEEREIPGFTDNARIDHLWEATLRAEVLRQRDHAEKALPLLAPFAEEIYERRDPRVVEVLKVRANIHIDLLQKEDALKDAQLLSNRCESIEPPLNVTQKLNCKALLGVVHMHLEQYDEALPLLQASVDDWRAAGIPFDFDYTQILNDLSVAKDATGAADLGQPEIEEVVRLRRSILTPPHDGLISPLNNLSIGYRRMGELDKAEMAARDAISVATSLYGPAHRQTMLSRSSLAITLGASKRNKEALEIYLELTDICENTPDQADNEACASYYHNLALNYRSLRQLNAAMSANEKEFNWILRLHGDSYPELAHALTMRGTILFEAGRMDEAARVLTDAQQRFLAAGMSSNRAMWVVHLFRARCLRVLKRYDDAGEDVLNSLADLDQQSNSNPRELMRSSLLRALVVADQGKTADARALLPEDLSDLKSGFWRRDEVVAIQRLRDSK